MAKECKLAADIVNDGIRFAFLKIYEMFAKNDFPKRDSNRKVLIAERLYNKAAKKLYII